MSTPGSAKADSIETPYGWTVASASVAIMSIGFGAPYVITVGLKDIAAEHDWPRWIPSLAVSAAYLGAGLGGILMGWWADRHGAWRPAALAGIMILCGCLVAALGNGAVSLILGYGLLIGFLGNGATFTPLVANTTRWFDKRRGMAVSIVTSGQSVAGALFPTIFTHSIEHFGWRTTLIGFGCFAAVTIAPLALLIRRPPPVPLAHQTAADPVKGARVLGLPGTLVFGVLCAAIIGCCVAMAMPMVHIVAFCSDLGFQAARGAEMLSLLLACAFMARLFWGRMADRLGALTTIMIGSAAQALALSLFTMVDGLIGLYVVAATFGLAFGGIVPCYPLAVRDLFPVADAGWRIGVVMFFGTIGMALGGWVGGIVFDLAASYRPAFLVGIGFNLFNLVCIGFLLTRQRRPPVAYAAA